MTASLAVLVMHGMGSQREDYAQDFIEAIDRTLVSYGKQSEQVAWCPVYWADILAPRQRDYWEAAQSAADLDYTRLRQFVISALGDAAAYRQLPSDALKSDAPDYRTYHLIHERIREQLNHLYLEALEERPRPLVIVAHSLGGHIMSNYVWDQQRRPDRSRSAFERMNWLTGMITFGCTIPLFTFACERVKPITFPPRRLPQRWKEKARWYNFYDPDDVLGYPLRPVSAAYADAVDQDIAVDVGGIGTSWNPACHGRYWTDDDFIRPVATYLSGFLES